MSISRPVIRRIATAALLTTAFGAIAIETEARIMASVVLDRLRTMGGLAFETAGVEPFSGQVLLHGVHGRVGDARIVVGTLRLPLPSVLPRLSLVGRAMASPFDDAPAASPAPAPTAAPAPAPSVPPVSTQGSTSADDVSIVVGDTTFRIKRIDMTGTALSNADLTALLDAKSQETVEARLKRFSAAAVVVPELLADQISAGNERHMSMSHILLANVVAGRASAGSAGEVSYSISGKGAGNGTTGAIEATNLDLTQIAHVFGTVRTSDAEPIKPLYDAFIVHSIKMTNDAQKSTLTVGSIREGNAKARPLATNLMDASATSTDPSDPKSAALFDDMVHSFQIGLLQLDDIALRSEAPNGVTTVTLAKAALTDVADRKVGGLEFTGFNLAGPDAKVAIGSVKLGTFVIPSKTAAASSVAPPASLDFAAIDVDVVSKTEQTADKPASTTNVKFKVDHVAFASTGVPGDIPTTSSVAVDKVSFDVPADDQSGLKAMGYQHVVVSGALSANYKASEQELVVDKLSVHGEDMGSLDTSVRLLNVGKGLLSADKTIQAASAVAVLVKSLDLKVTNEGLFQKALAYKAKADGVTDEKEREVGIDFFKNQLPAIANGNPKLKVIGDAVAAFIAEPKTLSLSIVSKAGLGIAAMGMLNSPDLILDGLDVQASADK